MDPQKRLQILQQSSPSIRIATQPQPSVQVVKPQVASPQVSVQQPRPSTGDIFLPGATQHVDYANVPTPVVAPPKKSFLQSAGDMITGGFRPLGAGIARLLPGGQNDIKANDASIAANAKNLQTYTDLFHQGKINKDQYAKLAQSVASDSQDSAAEAQRIGATADKSQVVGSALLTAATPFLGGVDALGGGLATRIGIGAAEGAGTGALNALATGANPTGKDYAEQAGIGAVTGGALPIVGKGLSFLKGKVFGNPASVGLDKTSVNYLKSEDDPAAIKTFLTHHLGIDNPAVDTAATKIAGAKSQKAITEAVGEILQHAPEEAVAGAATKTVLDNLAEGKLKAKQGAEAQAKTDADFQKAQEEALAQAGVDITPPGGKPIGDITDAKPAATEATPTAAAPEQPQTVLHLPEHGVHAKLTPEQVAILKDENKNIPWTTNDRPHLTAGDNVLEKSTELTPEEIGAISPNAKTALDNANKQIAEAAPAPEATPSAANPVKSEADVVAGTAPQGGTTDNASLGTDNPSPARQSVLDSLQSATDSYKENAKVRSTEKGQRIAKASGSFDSAGGGQAGVNAKLGALKGKYSAGKFEPIDALPEHKNQLYNEIESNTNLSDFDKLNAQVALGKVFGDYEGKPTPSDISNIRKGLGDDIANAVQEHVDAAGATTGEKIAAIAATPKAAMATADLSAPLRQGAVLGSRFPKQFADNSKDMVKYMRSQKNYDAAMKEVADRPSYELMKKAGLAVDGANGITGTEEQFMSSLLETKFVKDTIKIGNVAAGSDRAYTGFLTKFRADTFDHILEQTKKAGIDLGAEGNEKALKSVAEFINSASGRGNLGSLEKHAGLLSKALFSPRLWKSRLDLLNPVYYAKLDPVARKYALQASASFASTAATILGVASAAGATVVWDPRSADFAKIKVGNTRYDILGGLQQNIRLGAQLISGQKINSSTGELQTLGDGITTPSRKDLLYQFFENKENPLVGYATKVLAGKDAGGNPVNPATEAGKLLIPLNAQGIYETSKDQGNVGKGFAMNTPGIFGIGVQTYGDIASKNKGKDAQGNDVYTGKVEPNMVKDPNGKVMVDDKGKPVTVKFPDDATDVQKKALLDAKQSSLLTAGYKKNLSGEDQSLLNLSDNQLQKYVKDGTIDQAHYDKLQNYKKGAETYGKAIEVPDGVKSPQATAFYQKWNSMDAKDQQAWLKQAPDDNAKSVATEVSKQMSGGLKLNPSNELTQQYSAYEKDLNTHPDYTEVDLRNKAKAFQVKAFQTNYSAPQRDIYAEGGDADIKNLMANGKVSKSDLDAAIDLDNNLYQAGLSSSLKFSKKFRTSLGYDTPSVGGDGSSGGSGSSTNAHLTDLLPSTSTGKVAKAPQFSAKDRGIKFKAPNVVHGTTNSKKITIKL